MTTKTLTRSFAGGVITPEMLGRLDQVRYQTGLAIADGFETLPHGPATNSTGFEYVLEVKDSTKHVALIPFIYSTSQSMVLEFGDQYVRFHTAGGTLLEAAKNITGITHANPAVFTSAGHGYTTGQWAYLTAIGGATGFNGRFVILVVLNANTFTVTDLAGVALSSLAMGAYTAGGTVARVYEIASPYLEADLFDLHYAQSADVLTIVHTGYQQRELRRTSAVNWSFALLAFAPTTATPAAPTVVPTGGGGVTYTYVATALRATTLEESLASPLGATTNDLSIAGHFNSVTPAATANAVRFNIYKLLNGLYGYIGQVSADGSGFVDNNITPDTTKTPPIVEDPFVGATNYPGAVGYFQGRRWFGGTLANPQSFYATRSGTESNLSYSIPTHDDDRLAVRVAARQANSIRHFVPLEDMLMLTSGGEWAILALNSDAITPASVDPRPKGAIGASNVQPVITSISVLYAQDRGGRIREMKFYGTVNGGYKSIDISIMAPHYFDAYLTVQMAFTRSPHPIAWAVRNDGTLLGMTYVPEQEVSAWWSRTTQGFFESVCAVPEGSEDVLYAVVKRTVNGRTVRYVERKHSRLAATLADSFFVDAGLTYSGAAVTTLSGLWHLEGATVNALADGAVVRGLTVTNGAITLDNEASKITVGLQITARLQTLPLSVEMEAGGQGTTKNISKLHLRVNASSNIQAGPSFTKLKQVKQRTTEPYGSPPALVTDEKSVVLAPSWNASGQVCIEQADPLPLTVLDLTTETAFGG